MHNAYENDWIYYKVFIITGLGISQKFYNSVSCCWLLSCMSSSSQEEADCIQDQSQSHGRGKAVDERRIGGQLVLDERPTH
jgi:hypothetical protein